MEIVDIGEVAIAALNPMDMRNSGNANSRINKDIKYIYIYMYIPGMHSNHRNSENCRDGNGRTKFDGYAKSGYEQQ